MARKILLIALVLMFGSLPLILSSCSEEKVEQPVASLTGAAKPTQPIESSVDIEVEKSAILKMFNEHSAAVNANRAKGKKNLDDIFKYWAHDNSKSVAFYSIVTFGAPEDTTAETWSSVKEMWETLLTSDHPSAVSHYQNQLYAANLSNIVVKGSKASGTGNGRWGAGQAAKIVALFVKRSGTWYIQALEMNASPLGNRLQPLEL